MGSVRIVKFIPRTVLPETCNIHTVGTAVSACIYIIPVDDDGLCQGIIIPVRVVELNPAAFVPVPGHSITSVAAITGGENIRGGATASRRIPVAISEKTRLTKIRTSDLILFFMIRSIMIFQNG